MESMFFKISEIEKDYNHFSKVIIPEIEIAVMKMIALYCKGNKTNLS
jgi:phage host-nuclease inhibitor protein Gam